MPKKGETKQPKEPKEVKQDNEPKRADYKLRNYTEDNVNDDIAKIQKQIKKLELSINEHDPELEKKRSDHKEFQKQLKEMEAIKQLLADIEI
jgi:septal ring factor EnvC (AmiA/AmiB activator)